MKYTGALSKDQDLYFVRGHLGGSLVKEAERLGILDKWFTPVYQYEVVKPTFTINGYSSEFYDDYVVFGCAKITFSLLSNLSNLFKEENHSGFKEINKITIGIGEFTKAQIKEMLTYIHYVRYFNKK